MCNDYNYFHYTHLKIWSNQEKKHHSDLESLTLYKLNHMQTPRQPDKKGDSTQAWDP